jgi:hypothetical protein
MAGAGSIGARLEIPVALNGTAELAAVGFKFAQREIAELLLEAVHQAVERVAAVKLDGVPGPIPVGIEEFGMDERVLLAFCPCKWWELPPDFLCEQLHLFHLLSGAVEGACPQLQAARKSRGEWRKGERSEFI